MSALDWHSKMTEAPRLRHAEGMVLVVLGERAVLFPSEAAARFFHEAYSDIPNLTVENATLRAWIDEGALMTARAEAAVLATENAALQARLTELEEALASLAKDEADAIRRAKLLAFVLKWKASR